MKILLAIHEYLSVDSGAAGSTFLVGQQYIKLGHEVIYYSFNDLPQKLPLPIKDLLFPYFLAAYLARNVHAQNVDVIDASTGDAWFWSRFLRKKSVREPVLVTRSHYLEHIGHQQCLQERQLGRLNLSWRYYLYRGSINLWEVACSLRESDLIFVLNNEEKDYVVHNLEVEQEKVRVVVNGLPEAFLNLGYLPSTMSESSPLSIAIVGTYINRKGIQYSVPALGRVLARYPFISVSFLGTECPEEKVKEDFESSLRGRVHVVPHYEHARLPTLLKDHQISVLASTYEAFGKALIETMACGLAPISTSTAGPLSILTDGNDGVLVPARDSEAIEHALVRLITDRSLLEDLRSEAYATAQRYSWQNTARDRLKQYKVMSNRC